MEPPIEVKEDKRDLSQLSESAWQTAKNRYALVTSYLNRSDKKISVESLIKECGIHKATFYRWLKKFQKSGLLSSLIDNENSGGKGIGRLPSSIDQIVISTIDDRYLTKQRLSAKRIAVEISLKCREQGLKSPHYTTILKRIKNISEEKKLRMRYDSSLADSKYQPILGHYSEATYPLSVVQIDHTLLDIILVDDAERGPIGRPWFTVAIDVFSRMVLGFYVSLDPPGTTGTGLCISNAILPKQLWLSKMNVNGEWPCFGIMRSIHLDNAKEFHGNALERACQEYGIIINFRPVAKPQYGGHIERLIGTVLDEIHAVKGTTFSNTADRKFYNSEKQSCLTITELEKWLITFFVNVYHNRVHTSLKTSPLSKFTEGILGSKSGPGTGIQKPIRNELKLKLDFMPYVERTIQQYGVQINFIIYYHDILRRWINSYKDPGSNTVKSLFIFKIDPRDISVIYFYDPETKDYFAIPYRNTGFPPMTIWEYKKVSKTLHKEPNSEVTEQAIFDGYIKMKAIEDEASQMSMKRRRSSARTKQALNNSLKSSFKAEHSQVQVDEHSANQSFEILPFEDIEDEAFN